MNPLLQRTCILRNTLTLVPLEDITSVVYLVRMHLGSIGPKTILNEPNLKIMMPLMLYRKPNVAL